MYLHLGEKTVVNTANIIGIFDIENTSVSKDTKEFLRIAGHTGQVRYTGEHNRRAGGYIRW